MAGSGGGEEPPFCSYCKRLPTQQTRRDPQKQFTHSARFLVPVGFFAEDVEGPPDCGGTRNFNPGSVWMRENNESGGKMLPRSKTDRINQQR